MGATKTSLTLTEYLVLKIINDENEKCMIQSNELRIGNIVSPDPSRYGTVISFNEKRIKLKLEHSTLNRITNSDVIGLDVEGIPLSEEWLIKLGFEKKDQDKEDVAWCYTLKYALHPDDNPEVDLKVMSTDVPNKGLTTIALVCAGDYTFLDYNVVPIRALRYLHELQNLFFALSGNELNLSNDTRY